MFLFVILVKIDVYDKEFVDGNRPSNNITIRKCHSLRKRGQVPSQSLQVVGDREHYLTSDCSTSCKSTCGLISSIGFDSEEQRCARPRLRHLNSLPRTEPSRAQIEFERSQTAAWLWLGSALSQLIQNRTSGAELGPARAEPNMSRRGFGATPP